MNSSSPSGIESPALAELRQAPGRVHVWFFSLIPASPEDQTLVLLSTDERERARRLHFERDRTRFVVARSRVRRILGTCLGVAPDQIRFCYGTRGKPEVAEPASDLYFNLGHSGDWAILAIAGEPVGVDLEKIDPRVKITELARHFFSAEDLDWLLAQPEQRRQRAFFRLWVTREAWLKATGDGLSFPLDRLVTEWTDDSITALREHNGNRKGAILELFSLPPGYCAAVAMEHASPQVVLNRLQSP